MTLVEACILLAQSPGTMALSAPDRLLVWSPTGWLMMLGGKRPEYARLRLQDFLNQTWEIVTAEQLQARTAQNQ